MLIASNSPTIISPPTYLPPDPTNVRTNHNTFSFSTERHHPYDTPKNPLNNPTAIACIILSSLVTLFLLYWLFRYFQNKAWPPFHFPLHTTPSLPSLISSMPSSAPPSFSSVPPDMAVLRHPHPLIPSSTRSSLEPLPAYLSPYPPPPKYEQAIVTQIREDPIRASSAAMIRTDDPLPSMWVPVYFTHFRRAQVFGFTTTPSHSYWLQQLTQDTNISLATQQQHIVLSQDTPPPSR